MGKFLTRKVWNNEIENFIPFTPLLWVGRIEFEEFLYTVLRRLKFFFNVSTFSWRVTKWILVYVFFPKSAHPNPSTPFESIIVNQINLGQ